MIYYFVMMVLFLAINFDGSEALPSDCEYSEMAGMYRCQFYCFFKTSFSYCQNDLCCCGYDDGKTWQAFRLSAGERGCRDDPPAIPPKPKDCVPSDCEAACGPDYVCYENYCYCIVQVLYDNTYKSMWQYKFHNK